MITVTNFCLPLCATHEKQECRAVWILGPLQEITSCKGLKEFVAVHK